MKNPLRTIAVAGALLAAASAMAQSKPVCGLNNGKPATGEPIPIGAVVGKTGPDDFSASALAAQACVGFAQLGGEERSRAAESTSSSDGIPLCPPRARQLSAPVALASESARSSGQS